MCLPAHPSGFGCSEVFFAHCCEHSSCRPMRNHLPHYKSCCRGTTVICFGQHFSQAAFTSCCQILGCKYCTESAARTASDVGHYRRKRIYNLSLAPGISRSPWKEQEKGRKGGIFPLPHPVSSPPSPNPKQTKFFWTCGRAVWVVTSQQGLASDIISHSVLHTGDLCKQRQTQSKCS